MNTEIVNVKRDAETFLTIGKALLEKITALIITKPEDIEVGSQILKQCQTTEKDLELKRTQITKPVNDFLKEVNQLFKETAVPLMEAKTMVKEKMVIFNAQLERKRLEEQQKREQEERDRIRKIENERIEREQAEIKKREEEEKKLKVMSPEQKKAEEIRLENERQQRLQQEDTKRILEEKRLAEDKIKADIEAARLEKIKVSGVTKRFTFEIINEAEVSREFCSPDSKKINEAIKKGVRTIPGLRIFEVVSVK